MAEAAFWGLIAGSSLIVGALVSMVMRPSARTVGLVMAFGAGTLIAAVAYELIGTSIADDQNAGVAFGLLLGAIVFTAGNWSVNERGAHNRKGVEPAQGVPGEEPAEESGIAIALGTVLDGVPESFVMGMALTEGGGALSLIAAVFISNVPEAIGATSSLVRSGWRTSRIMLMWSAIAVMTSVSCVLGYALLERTSNATGEHIEAFAAGAIIAMLASTMMPEAYRSGGRAVGVVTALGFALGVGMSAA